MTEKLYDERINYIRQREWDAHKLSINECKSLDNQQAAYFIQRDLTFRRDVINKNYFYIPTTRFLIIK